MENSPKENHDRLLLKKYDRSGDEECHETFSLCDTGN